jgi:hypothetical protein
MKGSKSLSCFAFLRFVAPRPGANCACNNTAGNYSIVVNNRVAAIVVPALNASLISGNSGGSAFTTDPYANIAF